jgi:hypothetical protein
MLALLALCMALVLMQLSGLRLAGTVLGEVVIVTALLRWVGAGRVVLRYAERLFAHDAMFRALADLRVWFFRSLAHGAVRWTGLSSSRGYAFSVGNGYWNSGWPLSAYLGSLYVRLSDAPNSSDSAL